MECTLFTNEQKRDLKQEAWGKSSENIDKYVDIAERQIMDWLDSDKSFLSDVEIINQAEEVRSSCKKLLNILSKTNSDVLSAIALDIDCSIVQGYECDEKSLAEDLGVEKAGYSASDYDDKLWPMLNKVLRVVDKNTGFFLERIQPRTGPRDKNKEELIYMLAVFYIAHFKKKPSASENGNFYRFIKKMGSFLNVSFGKNTIKAGINRWYK